MSRPTSKATNDAPFTLRLHPEKFSECVGDIADPKREYEHSTGPNIKLALGPLGARNNFIKKTRLTVAMGTRQLMNMPIGEIALHSPKQHTPDANSGHDILSFIFLGPRMGFTWKKVDENKAYRYQLRLKNEADCNSLVQCFTKSAIIREYVKSQQSQPSSQRPSSALSRPGTSDMMGLAAQDPHNTNFGQKPLSSGETLSRDFAPVSGGALERQAYGTSHHASQGGSQKYQYSLWPSQSSLTRPETVGTGAPGHEKDTATPASRAEADHLTRPRTMPQQSAGPDDFAAPMFPPRLDSHKPHRVDIDAIVPPRQLPFMALNVTTPPFMPQTPMFASPTAFPETSYMFPSHSHGDTRLGREESVSRPHTANHVAKDTYRPRSALPQTPYSTGPSRVAQPSNQDSANNQSSTPYCGSHIHSHSRAPNGEPAQVRASSTWSHHWRPSEQPNNYAASTRQIGNHDSIITAQATQQAISGSQVSLTRMSDPKATTDGSNLTSQNVPLQTDTGSNDGPSHDNVLEGVRAYMKLPESVRRHKLQSTWETLIMSDEFLQFAIEVEATMPGIVQG